MSKPFKLQGDARVNIGRAGDGKFKSLEQASPETVAEKAKADGVTVGDETRRARVPDHPITEDGKSNGDVVYKETLPWPEAGPINDANKPPWKGLRKD